MLCYARADYFGLYAPGKLRGVPEGKIMPLGPTTQRLLAGTSIMPAVPTTIGFPSPSLKANLSRRLHIVLGALYTVFILIAMPGARAFYIFYGAVEVTLTTLID